MDHLVYGWVTWMFLDWQCHGKFLILDEPPKTLTMYGNGFTKRVHSAVNRSLGDVVAHSAGVISDPEFSEFELDSNVDKFLVVATDGLWEFINNQETLEIVEGQIGPAQAVDTLVTEAGTRWMQEEQVIDDTTVIVANLFGWKSSN